MTQRQVYTDTVKLRVFFEGVLFPYVKSVTVTESEGTVSAQVEVPPSLKLQPDQLAGMTCHIFYANKRVLTSLEQDPGDNSEPFASGWPILFQGELSGESISTTVQSENVVLTFVSHARHFEQTQLYFYDVSRQDNNAAIEAKRMAAFLGNIQINLEASGTNLDKRTQILTTLSRRIGELEQDTDRNIAFTATVLELLRSTGEQHAVFNFFDKKFKLSQRFAAYIDPDVKNILSLETLKSVIENRAQGLPSFASLMQLLDIPTSLMKYNWNQLAQPRLRPKTLPGNVLRTKNALDLSNQIKTATREFANIASEGVTKLDTAVGRIVIPKDYFSAQKLGDESKTFKGFVPFDTFVSDVFVEYEKLLETAPGDPDDLLTRAFQKQIDNYKVPSFGRLAELNAKAAPTTESETQAEAEKVLALGVTDEDEQKNQEESLALDQATLAERDELNEFTITPNLEFGQPPKCNVIFPASFNSYGINRNHLQEPTRLYGRVDLSPAASGEQNAVLEWYIAPLSQAYHFLDETNLARFSDAYAKFLDDLPNQIEEEEEDG